MCLCGIGVGGGEGPEGVGWLKGDEKTERWETGVEVRGGGV